ncbi:MAG TPA: M56 family metallopeptidase [Pirellulales bacterium]|nr:M56 family metallopeptidase [Pirellulales bacterium]
MNVFHAFELATIVQATAVTLAAIGLIGAFQLQAAMRHAIGVTGLFLVLASPLLALALPRPFWLLADDSSPAILATASDQLSAPPDGAFVGETPSDKALVVATSPAENAEPAVSRLADASELRHEAEGAIADVQDRKADARTWRASVAPWVLWIGSTVWGAGILWFAWRRARSLSDLSYLYRSLEAWPTRLALRDEDEICREFGFQRLPPVMLSDLAPMPLVLGIRKLVAVLPRSLAESATAEKLRTIIIHETAHIARRDPWILVAQLAAQTIFWWHPGVSWLNRHINRSREELCDNFVLRRSDAAGYAEMLLELVERRPTPLLLGLFSTRWSLEQRIVGLLHPRRKTATRTRPGSAAAFVLLLLGLSTFVGGMGVFDGFSSAAAPPQAAQESNREPADAAVPLAPVALKQIAIRGVCVDEDAKPIAGARVRIFRYPSQLDPPLLVADLQTEADGKFVAKEVDTAIDRTAFSGMGDLCVATTAENHVSLIQRIENVADEVELSLSLKDNPGTLSGAVTDEAGRPVADVRVFLPSAFQEPLPGILSAVTDRAGRYAIAGLNRWQAGDVTEVVVGGKREDRVVTSCNLLFDHPDFARTQAQYTAVPQTFNVTLHPPAIVKGVVVDAVTDRPAANVVVSAQGVARYAWFQTRTDRQGRYRLRMTKDHYNIWTEAEDRIAIAAKAIKAQPGKTVSIADIPLVRGGFVTGRVIDAATNKPPTPSEKHPLYVAHYGPARPRTGAAVTSTEVKADGTYRLRVAPGRNYIYLMNGQGSHVVSVEDGQVVRLDFRTGEHDLADSADLADSQLAAKLRQQAEEEDAMQEGRAVAVNGKLIKPSTRKRGDTPAGRLLDKLESQNSGNERFKDSWLRALKAIVDLGPDAVPELIEELDATQNDMMLRCLGFTLRAIGDKRAVPALIRAIPKTLRPPGSDMALQAADSELLKFAQLYDLDPGIRGNLYGLGRHVREICGTLEQLTGQNFGEEQIYNIFLDGLPSQQRMKRELYQRTAQAWTDWWEKNGAIRIADPAYARVNLPKLTAEKSARPLPPGAHLKTDDGSSGWVLESVLNPKSKTVLYDFDTGRVSDLPARWRGAKNIEPQLDEIGAWALREGFDLMGTEYAPPGGGERVFALRSIGLRAWELGADRWKMHSNDITVEVLQEEGTPADGLLLHYDKRTDAFDPKATATFLYITREGTPGLLFVGVEVQDDSLQPGGFLAADPELDGVAFRKGRRFGFTNFEFAQPVDVRAK